jgi:8-oxo-dGTP diphosphatase
MKRQLYRLAHAVRSVHWRVFRPITHGVKAIVVHDGRVLLVRHSYGSPAWSLPGGGYNPKREMPEAAAAREVREELGLEILAPKAIGQYESSAEYKCDRVVTVLATVTSVNVTLSAELTEAKWFMLDALPEMGALSRKSMDFL